MEASKYITLISMEGHEFVVPREAAIISPIIKRMIDPNNPYTESRTGRCEFQELSGVVLEKIAEYCVFWYKNKDRSDDIPDMEIPTELCLEILEAADFLQLDK